MNKTNGSGNSTEGLYPYELYSNTGKIVGYSLAYGLISVVALVGNSMVFMVMAMNRSMHTATNVLLLNLSISDVLFIVMSVPVQLAMEICNNRWVFGDGMAKAAPMLNIVCGASSVFTMMVIALERYIAVVHPLKHLARKKIRSVTIAMILIWLSAIALSIPMGIHSTLKRYVIAVSSDGVLTGERNEIAFIESTMEVEADKIYKMTIFVLLFIVPILALGLLYAMIIWTLWNPDRQLSRATAGASSGKRKAKGFVERARRKTTIMLVTVFVAFFVCMLPFNLFTIVVLFDGYDDRDVDTINMSNSVLRILVVLNSATNPIIYNFLSEKFRVGFRTIFSCRCRVDTARVAVVTEGETVLA